MKTLKPQHLRRQSESREAVWKQIRTLKEFTIPDLTDECDLAYHTIFRYLGSLVRAGYLEVDRNPESSPAKAWRGGSGVPHVYRLVRDNISPPRVRADGSEIDHHKGTQRMWNTIRSRKIFTLSDLHALSSTTQHPVARSAAMMYLKYLEYAGYVKKIKGTELARATYRLVINTGPKAPMVQRIRQVWDPNVEKVVWPVASEKKEDESGQQNSIR